jgi:hypothetical protein
VVETRGIVREVEDADRTKYEVIEDDDSNRVELEPSSTAEAYVGQQVDVIGRFHFDDRQGRSITVAQLTPTRPAAVAPRLEPGGVESVARARQSFNQGSGRFLPISPQSGALA